MKSLKLAIDLDGVCYWFTQSLRMYFHEVLGKPLEEMPAPTIWDFWDEWGMTMQEWLDGFNNGVREGHVFRHGDPMEGVVDGFADLREMGHSIHIVTSRPMEGGIRNTWEWLDEQGLKYDSLTVLQDRKCPKTIIDFDVLLDDLPDHCVDAVEAGKQAVVFSGPLNAYNCEANYPNWTGRRVDSWDEFVRMVRVGTFHRELVAA